MPPDSYKFSSPIKKILTFSHYLSSCYIPWLSSFHRYYLPLLCVIQSKNYILIFGVIDYRYIMSLWLLNSFVRKSYSVLFVVTRVFSTKLDLSLIFFFLGIGKSLGHFAGMFILGYISIIRFHFLYVIIYTVASFCNKFLQWIRNNFFTAIAFLSL